MRHCQVIKEYHPKSQFRLIILFCLDVLHKLLGPKQKYTTKRAISGLWQWLSSVLMADEHSGKLNLEIYWPVKSSNTLLRLWIIPKRISWWSNHLFGNQIRMFPEGLPWEAFWRHSLGENTAADLEQIWNTINPFWTRNV